MNFISTCGTGLEDLVVGELKNFSAGITSSSRGIIRWAGSLEAGYRACLWSRFSSRVVLVLSEFDIGDTDDLYEGAKSTIWEDHLSLHDSFSVDCILSAPGPVTNSMFGALRIKDGIVDRFRERQGARPSVQVQRPSVRVYLQVHGDRALLGLDLSGEGLHRRGYRAASGPAPLKENLAAAIIAMSGWKGDTPLIDPMCGSATLLIEAALIRADSAPGLGRTYFGLTGWRGHQKELWESLISEALERETVSQQQDWPPLIGYDGDRTAVRAARKNISRAGFEDRIIVEHQEIHGLKNRLGQPGSLVCNPPYGERLSDSQSVKHLYRHMGECIQREFSDWRITLFTAAPDYADRFKISFDTSTKIFNGPLACRLFSGSPQPVQETTGLKDWRLSDVLDEEEKTELSNRLKKNFHKLQPLTDTQNLNWVRLYDRDLPQFNVTIDMVGNQLYINEFRPPSEKIKRTADERFREVTHTVRTLFGIGRDRVVVNRSRARQVTPGKGSGRQKLFELREGKALFLVGSVNDQGVPFFPEQRSVRKLIGETIGQGKFLSIFDPSGGATVSAVLGGANQSATICVADRDEETLSINFSRNGLYPGNHGIVKDNAMAWLKKNREQFDLIYVYFRQKRYRLSKTLNFDVLSGHRHLLERAIAGLADGGRLIVSSLLPAFELDSSMVEKYNCKDISRKMSSPDLPRAGRNFRCWEISRSEVDESETS
ncbi:MAG: bifunctional 23S rRNA (guanine(2069)-N(7))-methyltransferase RlmK/23S rRNA (guanine(2445)-N(2))-methyltransferase RlmL [Desulfocapsaceae bacterium]